MAAPAGGCADNDVVAGDLIRFTEAVFGRIYRKYGTNFGTRLIVTDKMSPCGWAH